MGKYKKGILGNFRGRVGTVIGSVWRGVYYMRSVADYVNSNPSESQLNSRFIFAMVVAFAKGIKVQINRGYQQYNKGMTPMNAATSYLLKHAVTGVAPDFEIDFGKVLLSIGDLEAPEVPEVETQAGGKLVFSWAQSLDMEYGKPTDVATFFAYNEVQKKWSVANAAATRSALTYTMQLPMSFVGEEVQVYMMFVSVDGKEVSTSSYVGGLEVV